MNRVWFNLKFKRKELKRTCRLVVLERDKSHCIQCGAWLKHSIIESRPKVELGVFHHIIPQIYGGLNHHSNACLLCTSCHIKTHAGAENKQKYHDMMNLFILKGRLWHG